MNHLTAVKHFNELFKAFYKLDSYTKKHSYKVAKHSCLLASNLRMPSEFISNLFMAALFHDIGKSFIPLELLHKPGKLTADQFKKVMEHPEMGSSIIKDIPLLSPLANAILCHHERYDGKGYPGGLDGHTIPIEARIISIADSFDAMTSSRPYKEKMGIEDSLEELAKCSGTQFDPELVTVFVNSIKRNKEIAAAPNICQDRS